MFIAVGLIMYAGFLKLAARILRYSVSWKSSLLFAGIMMVVVIFGHVLALSESLAIRVGHNVVLLLGSWFFSWRGTNRDGAVVGWSGGLRLVGLMFVMMIGVAFVIVIPIQIFLRNHLSPMP